VIGDPWSPVVEVNDSSRLLTKRLEYTIEIYVEKSIRAYVLFCESRTVSRLFVFTSTSLRDSLPLFTFRRARRFVPSSKRHISSFNTRVSRFGLLHIPLAILFYTKSSDFRFPFINDINHSAMK